MIYAGLTREDKPALEAAKAQGFKRTKPFHQSLEEWDIDTALSQIAEMESAENPLTCDGCKQQGEWDNELEYGYNCPCIACKRNCVDRYEPKGESK